MGFGIEKYSTKPLPLQSWFRSADGSELKPRARAMLCEWACDRITVRFSGGRPLHLALRKKGKQKLSKRQVEDLDGMPIRTRPPSSLYQPSSKECLMNLYGVIKTNWFNHQTYHQFWDIMHNNFRRR